MVRREICDQSFVTGNVLTNNYHGFSYPRVPSKSGLDLTELDSESRAT